MNYIGSKYSLLRFLEDSITEVVGQDLSSFVFCDLFAGTGAVAAYFKSKVKKVIANDWELYSYVLVYNLVKNTNEMECEALFQKLNFPRKLKEGFIFQQYSEGGEAGRLYFSKENGLKIDTARRQIELWKKKGQITDDQYYHLLASLIKAADKVANTASVYGAYLKSLKKSALKPLDIVPIAPAPGSNKNHKVYREDSNKLIRKLSGDILYLDPPYNSRQYGANYHLLNTIAEYKYFAPRGKTGLGDYLKSDFSSAIKVKDALEELLTKAKFRYIFLSYNNEGLLPEAEIKSMMKKLGKYKLFKTDYNRFKADKTENRNHRATKVEEHLHVLIKDL